MAETTKKYHHGNLREALIECGMELIETRGISALTLRAVAEAANVSRQAPYNHFRDKDALLAAIATSCFKHLSETMRKGAQQHEDAEQRLISIGVAYVRIARRMPKLFELCSGNYISDFGAHPDLEAARHDAYSVLYTAMVEFLQAHNLSPELAVKTSPAAWAMAHGLARLLIGQALEPGKNGLPSESVLVREALQIVTRGITAD